MRKWALLKVIRELAELRVIGQPPGLDLLADAEQDEDRVGPAVMNAEPVVAGCSACDGAFPEENGGAGGEANSMDLTFNWLIPRSMRSTMAPWVPVDEVKEACKELGGRVEMALEGWVQLGGMHVARCIRIGDEYKEMRVT